MGVCLVTRLTMFRTTSNEQRLKEQLVPFGEEFPLLTAEEAREFQFSGYGFRT